MKDIVLKTFFFTALLVPFATSAQESGDSITEKNNTQFKLGIYYNTNLNYYGRTDSLKSQGFFSVAELWFDKNLYIGMAPVFVNNAVQSFEYAGTVATAGYRFGRDKKDAGNLYIVKPFYQGNSQLVQSALKAQVAGTYSWLNKIVNITGGGDIKFSDKVDYGVTAGLAHLFRIEPGSGFVVILNPSVYVNAGTQQFTKTYYRKNSFLLFPGLEEQVTENVKNFNLLSYEFSIPVVAAKGKFQLIAIPAYVVPRNLVMVEGRPDLSERGKNLFYATVGAKVNF